MAGTNDFSNWAAAFALGQDLLGLCFSDLGNPDLAVQKELVALGILAHVNANLNFGGVF